MTNYDILKEYEAHKTPVPSYDEWLEKTKSLKVLAEAYCKEKQKNAQLKELLKECRLSINGYPPYESGSEILKLTYKIKEALK